jgi:hypothetical protein
VENFFGARILLGEFSSAPFIDQLPPDQAHPFIDECFGPLAVGPPTCSELRVVASSRDRVCVSGKFAAESIKGAAGMEVRRDNEYALGALVLDTTLHIV